MRFRLIPPLFSHLYRISVLSHGKCTHTLARRMKIIYRFNLDTLAVLSLFVCFFARMPLLDVHGMLAVSISSSNKKKQQLLLVYTRLLLLLSDRFVDDKRTQLPRSGLLNRLRIEWCAAFYTSIRIKCFDHYQFQTMNGHSIESVCPMQLLCFLRIVSNYASVPLQCGRGTTDHHIGKLFKFLLPQ